MFERTRINCAILHGVHLTPVPRSSDDVVELSKFAVNIDDSRSRSDLHLHMLLQSCFWITLAMMVYLCRAMRCQSRREHVQSRPRKNCAEGSRVAKAGGKYAH